MVIRFREGDMVEAWGKLDLFKGRITSIDDGLISIRTSDGKDISILITDKRVVENSIKLESTLKKGDRIKWKVGNEILKGKYNGCDEDNFFYIDNEGLEDIVSKNIMIKQLKGK